MVADLDNDLDMDIYMACTSLVRNVPNLLFENLGGALFQVVAAAGGAEGTLEGRADSVVAADYDRDGYVDLFVTNGDGGNPFNDGPNQLFRNLGGANHWIEIDLVGTQSNRDGVGARIEVEAGGLIQVREQNGGIHRWAQNHQRLHVGLGSNPVADRIVVHWPSGIEQTLIAVPADQVLTVVEAASIPVVSAWGWIGLVGSFLGCAAMVGPARAASETVK